jgi:hypothetical protein
MHFFNCGLVSCIYVELQCSLYFTTLFLSVVANGLFMFDSVNGTYTVQDITIVDTKVNKKLNQLSFLVLFYSRYINLRWV